MRIVSPLPHRRGRLEIIPLIDIMFFPAGGVHARQHQQDSRESLKVNLPTNVPTAQIEKKEDFISISVNAESRYRSTRTSTRTNPRCWQSSRNFTNRTRTRNSSISADKDARHGDVIAVLGELRAAGFQKVAFSVSQPTSSAAPTAAPAPDPSHI